MVCGSYFLTNIFYSQRSQKSFGYFVYENFVADLLSKDFRFVENMREVIRKSMEDILLIEDMWKLLSIENSRTFSNSKGLLSAATLQKIFHQEKIQLKNLQKPVDGILCTCEGLNLFLGLLKSFHRQKTCCRTFLCRRVVEGILKREILGGFYIYRVR